MTEDLILQQLHQLPEALKQEVLHYVEFLRSKLEATSQSNGQVPFVSRKSMFGSAQGKYEMAPDFNEPLDDFKEYM